ncbi:uncharacterized protein MONBRDRAFT_24057 [Monosiga brevicollis MX1]|uniref:Transcription initiation factor IIE subunit alpha N-terminal domain-containing protein n=1 Tax=Monosiga brevicollis TaxID=81824 RepID=A9UUK4_MONBE|nr:uncharacterized protein MONBRDRAFT_24057 [Monosiga brevicollis MX1]EDQ90918.1 predicted protein [Monosiga brevicollis MX1]|eukprot:XP_001744215.1 hypothetical protein [Monosiga brevicollis MX1]
MDEDQEILFIIPPEFQELARKAVRAFYGNEPTCVVLLDLIIAQGGCVKDAVLEELTQLERSTIKGPLSKLRQDHMLQEHAMTDPFAPLDARSRKATYWFINYPPLINALKYKLLRLRHMLDEEAKQARFQSNYVCPKCSRSYTDMDYAEILVVDKFVCPQCRLELEDRADQSKADRVNQLMSRLSEQTVEFQKLLQYADTKMVSEKLTYPKVFRNPLEERHQHMHKARSTRIRAERHVSQRKRPNQEYNEDKSVVSFVNDTEAREQRKAQPLHLQQNTVLLTEEEASAEMSKRAKLQNDSSDKAGAASTNQSAGVSAMLARLQAQEEQHNPSDELDGDESDFEGEDDDEDDEFEDAVYEEKRTMMIDGQEVDIDDVTDEMVAEFDAEQIEIYNELFKGDA